MAISVRFRLRPPAPGKPYSNPNPIQVRITVDGTEDAGFSTKLKIDPLLWDQDGQNPRGRSEQAQQVSRALTKLKAKLERIEGHQADDYEAGNGSRPTVQSVKLAYLIGVGRQTKPLPAPPTVPLPSMPISSAVLAYVEYLRANGLKDQKTIAAYERNLRFLADYLTEQADPEPTALSITCQWVRRYRHYLSGRVGLKRKDKLLGSGQVNLICRQLFHATEHLYNIGILENNSLAGLKLDYAPPKEVVFLTPDQVERLFSLRVANFERASLWWTRLLCLTGLDYPDAQRYVSDRASYEQKGTGGKKIVIRRGKKPYNECNIPYSSGLDVLFAESVPEPPALGKLCYDMAKFAPIIGYDHPGIPFTPKVCRKTAGSIFSWDEYTVKAVSNILGHSTTQTTERHYLKITGVTVDLEMQKRQKL
ncbi:hypothetical protein [Spirosoma sp.]|uniref:hypothetical protein n=1 Tax=Spirosoma sp. TaxID=1899569 RepID=UPI002604E40A|nr:hypothetical protein [Spirosoma sp.]MCX6217566.1 hypothetical protein [Spirosoma sp.]